MYLRTPKRYRPKKRRIHLISRRTAVLMVLIRCWPSRVDDLAEPRSGTTRGGENVVPAVEDLVVSARTQVAPKPTPTVTPDLSPRRPPAAPPNSRATCAKRSSNA